MKLITTFDYSSVAYNKENVIHMMVSARAPKLELDKSRTPVNIVATLDVSPSMAGAKIQYAKKSLMKLIDHLSPQDKLGIVAFDGGVQTILEVIPMDQAGKDRAKTSVQQVSYVSYGGTNLSGAALEATRLALGVDGNCRIILFTDGQPNVGVSRPEQLIELMKNNSHKKISVTTFGYGDDHDSKLLTSISEVGKGNYAYIKNPDDALSAFALELGGLLSCYAQNLKFSITPHDGVEILEVLSDVDVVDEANGVKIDVADLYGEEVRNLVLKIKLGRQPKVYPRDTSIADIILKWDNTSGKSQKEEIKAKVRYVKEADVQKTADQEVVDQVALAQIFKAQAMATQFAAQGNFTMATSTLDSLVLGVSGVQGSSGAQGPTGAVANYANTTKGYFADNSSFTSSGHVRSASLRSNKLGRGLSGADTQMFYASNSMQNSMVDAFKQDDQQGILQGAQAGSLGISIGSSSAGTGGVVTSQGLAGSGVSVTIANTAGLSLNMSAQAEEADKDKTGKKTVSKRRSQSQW